MLVPQVLLCMGPLPQLLVWLSLSDGCGSLPPDTCFCVLLISWHGYGHFVKVTNDCLSYLEYLAEGIRRSGGTLHLKTSHQSLPQKWYLKAEVAMGSDCQPMTLRTEFVPEQMFGERVPDEHRPSPLVLCPWAKQPATFSPPPEDSIPTQRITMAHRGCQEETN